MEQLATAQPMNSVSEVTLVYLSKVKASDRPRIVQAKDAYDIFLQNWDTDKIELQEQCKVMYVNRANRVLGIYDVSTGGCTSTVVDLKLVFATALKINASGLILAHNHPSGNLKASTADEHISGKIKHAGLILDIRLLDHLIISNEGYFSMEEEGLL